MSILDPPGATRKALHDEVLRAEEAEAGLVASSATGQIALLAVEAETARALDAEQALAVSKTVGLTTGDYKVSDYASGEAAIQAANDALATHANANYSALIWLLDAIPLSHAGVVLSNYVGIRGTVYWANGATFTDQTAHANYAITTGGGSHIPFLRIYGNSTWACPINGVNTYAAAGTNTLGGGLYVAGSRNHLGDVHIEGCAEHGYIDSRETAPTNPDAHGNQIDHLYVVGCGGTGLYVHAWAADNMFGDVEIGSCAVGCHLLNGDITFDTLHTWGNQGVGTSLDTGSSGCRINSLFSETNGSTGLFMASHGCSVGQADIWANGKADGHGGIKLSAAAYNTIEQLVLRDNIGIQLALVGASHDNVFADGGVLDSYAFDIDGNAITHAVSTTASSATVTATAGTFLSAHLNMWLVIPGAGVADATLTNAQIQSVAGDGSSAVLTVAPSTSVTNAAAGIHAVHDGIVEGSSAGSLDTSATPNTYRNIAIRQAFSSSVVVNAASQVIRCPGVNPQATLVVASSGSSLNMNATLYDCYDQTLTNSNIASITFLSRTYVVGQEMTLIFRQDSTGSRTVTGWASNIKLAYGALTLSTTANAVDVVRFRYDGTNWQEIARKIQDAASARGALGLGTSAFVSVTADTTGATDASSAFTTADALTADKYLPFGTYKLSSSLTLSGKWRFEKGVILKPDANVVLTITGQFDDPGAVQLFDLTNAGARVQLDGFFAFARPEWWGAKGDWQHVTDAAMTNGSAVLTSATGRFAATDVNKNIGVAGAQADGSGHFNTTLTTTILSYQSPTQVTLATAATADTSGAEAQWWTNDQAAVQQCINGIAGAAHKRLELSTTYVCHRSASNAWAIDLSKRGVADGVTTNGSPNISSATAHFTKNDEGCYIAATGIPLGAKILRVTSPTTAVMDQNATATGTTRTFVVPLANLTIAGVKGQAYIKHPTGMPNASVAIVRANGNANLICSGVGFDGTWGNYVGNSQTGPPGVNHVFQSDPKNYALQLRGVTNSLIEGCDFRQTYGDMIGFYELAESATTFPASEANRALDVRVAHCTGDMSARDAVVFGAMCERLSISHSSFTNIHTQPFDFEPVGTYQYVRDVHIDNCTVTGWFDKTNLSENDAVAMSGGFSTNPAYTHQISGIKVTNCTLSGGIFGQDVRDILVKGCRIIKDWTTADTPCVRFQGDCDNVLVEDCWVYSSVPGSAGAAVMDVVDYASGTGLWKPANVTYRNNAIFAKNGRHGIKALGTGQAKAYAAGTTYATGAVVRDANVTYLSLVGSNTGNTPASSPTFWSVWDERTGDGSGGWVVLDDNLIDCFPDANGAGGDGIYLDADGGNGAGPNMRVRAARNRFRAPDTYGLNVKTNGSPSSYLHLQILDNLAWDDQASPTCAATVHFESPMFFMQLKMTGNVAGEGVAAAVSGLASGTWQTGGDLAPTFAGFGSPEGVVTAPIGASYARLDGTTNAATYRKETGTGDAGWVADSAIPGAVPIAKSMTADAVVNNTSTVYTTLTELSFTIGANETWRADYDLFFDGAAGADIKFQVILPSGGTFSGSAIGPPTSASQNASTQMACYGGIAHAVDIQFGTIAVGSSKLVARIAGVFTNGATAGTALVKFTQSVATGSDTTVRDGSSMLAVKV